LWWDQQFLDGIGVDAIVDFGQCALEVPFQRRSACFFVLEALEFLDEVQLELWAEPRAELERNVFVGIGATTAPCFGIDANGAGGLDPFFRRQREAIQTGLALKPIEFDRFKRRVVDLFLVLRFTKRLTK